MNPPQPPAPEICTYCHHLEDEHTWYGQSEEYGDQERWECRHDLCDCIVTWGDNPFEDEFPAPDVNENGNTVDVTQADVNGIQSVAADAAASGETQTLDEVLNMKVALDFELSKFPLVKEKLERYIAAAVQAEKRLLLEKVLTVAPEKRLLYSSSEADTTNYVAIGHSQGIEEYKANIIALVDSEQQKLGGKS